ncbi:putative phytanoyl-CoA dioxygenase [Armadillidium vulgare]|nr:putative phytanoyl-CoA dioxygenase [Armadillidium vulgare]
MKFLTKEQLDFYHKNGYIAVDVFSADEIDEMSREYDEIFQRKEKDNLEATWKGDWKKGKDKLEVKSIHGLQMHSAVFSQTILHKKLLDVCEDVMGNPNILLHHTKAHLKPPGTGSPFPMHQDYHYFPFKNDSMIAVFISLDKSDSENGGLCVYPGSHLLGPQKDISDSEQAHYLDPKEFPIEKAVSLPLERGQKTYSIFLYTTIYLIKIFKVVIFSYLLIHGSYDNTSDRVRRMFLIQLMSAEDEPSKELCTDRLAKEWY